MRADRYNPAKERVKKWTMRKIAACIFLPIGLIVAAATVQAQRPTAAQREAIRQSCRSDFMANCAGVQPGGKDAFECLTRNLARLADACKTAVSAMAPQPATPAAAVAPAAAPAATPAAATPTEVQPLPAAPKPAAAPTPAAVPKPATAVVPAAKPAPAQAKALRTACRSDFIAHCSGITPGGAEALQCLQRSSAQLSGPCQNVVAAIGGGPPAAVPAAATGVAAAAPGFPQLGQVRPMLPRRAIMILGECRADQETLCPSVPPGGGRVLSCLAQNSPRLSPQCYKALAPVTQ